MGGRKEPAAGVHGEIDTTTQPGGDVGGGCSRGSADTGQLSWDPGNVGFVLSTPVQRACPEVSVPRGSPAPGL